MSDHDKLSCLIIGEGTLPIQCIEILLQAGHTVCGLVSADAALLQWAAKKNIAHLKVTDALPTPVDLVTWLGQQPFDYLFSIVNHYTLPPAMLALPQRGAINYHDGPLPKYAGSHVTSWAILQGETTYAVTWHVMTPQVNVGDILKQYTLDITTNETALTLNTKCYDAAIRSFAQLIDDLAHGQGSACPQNLAERTFFSRCQKPSAGGLLSWQCDAADLEALIRALHFGPYPNPLGCPKFVLDTEFLLAPEIEVLDSLALAPPGTITHLGSDFLKVATASHEVILRQLLTVDSHPLPIPDLVAKFGLYEGYRLPDPRPETADRITTLYAALCPHESSWVKRLATVQPISLPYMEKTTPPEQPARRASLPMPIPAEVMTFLGPQGQQPTWRLSDFLLAAWAAYLARLNRVDCFDLGFKPAELRRSLAGLEGLFSLTIPLRIELNARWRFEQIYQAVCKQVELVHLRQTYARDVLARYPELSLLPKPGVKSLWPVTVEQVEKVTDLQTLLNDAELLDGKLTLVISLEETSPLCYWLYDPQALTEPGLTRVINQFCALLHSAVTQPQQPLANLSLLPEDERRQVLVEWNQTNADYPHDRCLHELFEAQVERTPEAIAMIPFTRPSASLLAKERERMITYRELNQRANQLAHHLQVLGVGPEVIVGVCMARSLEMVVGLLGILKAGGAYVPLDPVYPKERLALMLTSAQAPVLLTQQRLVENLPEHKAQVVCLDKDWPAIARHSVENPASGVTSQNLAYVLFTSGSTGQPKGVAIEHCSPVALVAWASQVFTASDLVGVLASTSLNFDLSVFELFVPLSWGGRVILAENVLHLPTLPAARQVTLINTVPSVMAELLRAGNLPASVRTVNLAGEPLRPELVQQIYRQKSVQRVFDLYGPSEDTTYSTFALRQSQGPATIGRPIANTQAYLLDEQLQPVPIGIPGELYLGGAGLARGYLNHPTATAEKFIPNPFHDFGFSIADFGLGTDEQSESPKSTPVRRAVQNLKSSRLYKTGDLARYQPDGNLEFLGRLDYQVKVRGYRIELGEIETALNQHPAVQENVVVAQEDKVGDKRLIAYIVPKRTAPLSLISELRRFLQTKLPDYMLPSIFMLLDALPLTPNRKVDRRALPTPDLITPPAEETFVAPRTPTEALLADIWTEVLGLERVGIHDNFFELGGQSLLGTRVISRLRDRLQLELPLRIMFEAVTIASLAEHIETLRWAAQAALPISPDGRFAWGEREEGEL